MTGLCLALSRNPGTDTKLSSADAYREAKKAYGTGRAAGKFALGYCLLTATGVEKNDLAGRALLKQASDEGFLLANLVLADQVLAGTPSGAELARAGEWLDAAERGGIAAAGVRRVALDLKHGRPTPEDRVKYLARVRPAADAGNAAAQLIIYELIASTPGDLSETEKAEAMKRLTQAAEAGSAEAQFRLAVECYQKKWFQGRLSQPQDFAAAREWATLASDQGFNEANKILAMIFIAGDGVKVDYIKATNYYKRHREKTALDKEWFSWFAARAREAEKSPDKNS